MTVKDSNWFTEIDTENGAAWSLQIDKILHQERTEHQQIEIYATTGFGNLMVIDGFVMLTSRDNFLYHEMMSHPAIYTHPQPQRVVIIGGGDCGTLREVLKHRCIESVLQVEIDERVTRLSEQYFPELCESNTDSRVEFFFGDGIQWMKDAAAGSVDLIIVDSTDPIGPAEGLFTEDFYRDCHRTLGEHGLVVQQSESPLLHLESIIHPMHRAMRTAGFTDTASLHFPQPCYPSGWWTATLAGKQSVQDFREMTPENMDIDTRYYTSTIHRASLVQPRFMLHLPDIW